jgi:hypothetical protein
MNVSRSLAVLGIAGLLRLASAEDAERMWVEGQINSNAVHLAFDSGSTWSFMTHKTAQKLGIRIMPPQTNFFLYVRGGTKDILLTEECFLDLGTITGLTSFLALDPVWDGVNFDAALGWLAVTNSALRIDALAGGVTLLNSVPAFATDWAHVPLATNLDVLALEIPHDGATNGILAVDTGYDKGLALPAKAWRRWKSDHPQARFTLGAGCTPSDGFYTYEETLADTISVGPISFTNIPIEEASPAATQHFGQQYEGTLGLSALKRL